MTGLDASKRASVAVCHIYIAQAILFDDYASIRAFCRESAPAQRAARWKGGNAMQGLSLFRAAQWAWLTAGA